MYWSMEYRSGRITVTNSHQANGIRKYTRRIIGAIV